MPPELRNSAEAQNNLGIAYQFGDGVPRDLVTAFMWLTLAAAQGDWVTKSEQKLVEEEMTPAEVAEARRRARKWAAKHGK